MTTALTLLAGLLLAVLALALVAFAGWQIAALIGSDHRGGP